MENGWIKLHRKITEEVYYKKSTYIHLWIHLLLLASHKQKEYMTNDKIIFLKEGQFVTGRKQLSESTGISETTIERILKVLESGHQIEQQKTTKYRIITIIKWVEYQKTDNKRTTNGQQTDTIKNDKNDKKNNIADKSAPSDFKETMDYYHRLVVNAFKFKPEIRGKDCKMLKTILSKYGKEETKKIIYWYLGTDRADVLGIDLSICLSANIINRYHNENK